MSESGSGSGSPTTSPPGGENDSPPSDSPTTSSQYSPPFGNDTSEPSPPSDSGSDSGSPPPSGSGSSPPSPSDGDSPSPPSGSSPPSEGNDSSSSPPPPPHDSSSNSNSPPPKSSPPPNDSGSSSSSSSPPPPSDSDKDSSPPPPPSNSHKDSSPPPPKEGSSSSSKSPPPPSQEPSSSAPPPHNPPLSGSFPSPPPPSESSPDASPPPPAERLEQSPPAKSGFPPNESPPLTFSPPVPHDSMLPTAGDGAPKGDDTYPSPTAYHSPKRTSPSKDSDATPSIADRSTPESSKSSQAGVIIGATVAGLVLISVIAILFLMTRRSKRRSQAYTSQYGPPPDSFTVTTDGYYYGPLQPVGVSQEYYSGTRPPPSTGFTTGNFGSNRGNALSTEGSGLASSQSSFSYEEMMQITNGFARENILGEGGFGAVHKGWLPDGRVVAVKQLKVGSGQGEREFQAEVEIISRVHHRHLVSLVGYCIAEHHRLLVYEFVPNGTLEYHLHGEGLPAMDWSKRLKIAIGSARGLAYLHEDCHPKIIHRDIKSANILVDNVFEAQVADFGLAKLSTDTYTHVSTRVMGTFGYMAPEYASSGKLTDRSDVYSFGVVLLEMVTGRKPVDPTQPMGDESLVEWARPLLLHALETGDISELVDPRLEKRYVESEMFTMIETAAACIRHSAPKRPRMVQVLRALDNDGDMIDLSNGVKYGQSTVYESRQYSSDIQKFRKMAFGSEDSSEYDMYSGELNSRDHRPQNASRSGETNSSDFTSGKLETRAINPQGIERSTEAALPNSRRF